MNLEAQHTALEGLSDVVLMIVVWALVLVAEDFVDTPECFCKDHQVNHPDRLYFETIDPFFAEPNANIAAQEEARSTMEAMARCYMAEIERRGAILQAKHARQEEARAQGIKPRDDEPSDEDRPAYMDNLHGSMECMVAHKHLAELVTRLRAATLRD